MVLDGFVGFHKDLQPMDIPSLTFLVVCKLQETVPILLVHFGKPIFFSIIFFFHLENHGVATFFKLPGLKNRKKHK